MTLVLAVWNEAGVAVAADGLATYGVSIGAQQIPIEKLAVIGDRCVAGIVNEPTKAALMIEALKGSPLGTEPTSTRTASGWLAVAREAIATWSSSYLQHVIINKNMTLDDQIPASYLVIAGIASDGSFAYQISWLGTHNGPDATNYLALGSGAMSARIYLDAYSYFRINDHPVISLQALAARVMAKVSGNNIEIGGDITIALIHKNTTPEHPEPVEVIKNSDARVRDSVAMWELLESELDSELRKAW